MRRNFLVLSPISGRGGGRHPALLVGAGRRRDVIPLHPTGSHPHPVHLHISLLLGLMLGVERRAEWRWWGSE